MYLYDGTNWNSLDLQASPFTRNPATGIITPVRGGDDLDMTVAGSYLIQTLPDLDTGIADPGGGGGDGGNGGGGDPDVTITLSSNSWVGTNALANNYFFDQGTCGGDNDSPQLSWTVTGDIPDGATFRLRCIDVDATNFVHWSVDDIPSTVTSIAKDGPLPAGATANTSGFGGNERANGWAGPCPPADSGDHNYTFAVSLFTADNNLVATSNEIVSTVST